MEAKDLVGKWICSDYLEDTLNAPAGAEFKVVGYTTYGKCIVDGGLTGWRYVCKYDRIVEECNFYLYVSTGDITKVL